MEQTLGKRISQCRKLLGLTQDQLAEKLGITAQAVSKWENDQSCPDITMLPRLAEIFGTTTDALLGCEKATQEPVREAEVVENVEWASDTEDGDRWAFHWDVGRGGALTFAALVLLVGGLLLAARLMQWEVSFWSILWPCALLVYGVEGVLKRFSFFGVGCTLFGGYYLLNNLGIYSISIGGELIFPIIILLLGLSLLADAMKKNKKPQFQIAQKGSPRKTKFDWSNSDDSFRCDLTFGEKTHRVTARCLKGGEASCTFGELEVDLSGCETVAEDCHIDASCTFGELVLRVPRKFRVEADSSTAFGCLDFHGEPDPQPEGTIYLSGEVSFGEICVRYI